MTIQNSMKSFAFLLSFFLLGAASYTPDPSPKQPVSAAECLTPEELKLYDMIIEYRKSANLPPIPLSQGLTKVAKAHTQDLMDNYNFSPDNTCNPHSWSEKGSWTPCCYTADHKQAQCMWNKPKEIAGYGGSGYEIAYYTSGEASAEEALDGWKLSPGHNPLLINTGIWASVKWKAMGIALYKNYGAVWFGEVVDSPIQPCE
jgi:uncharacterized protein YkwD